VCTEAASCPATAAGDDSGSGTAKYCCAGEAGSEIDSNQSGHGDDHAFGKDAACVQTCGVGAQNHGT